MNKRRGVVLAGVVVLVISLSFTTHRIIRQAKATKKLIELRAEKFFRLYLIKEQEAREPLLKLRDDDVYPIA